MEPPEPYARLRRLLEAAEYQVTDRPEGWLAVRGRDRRALVLLREARAPHDIEAAFPARSLHRAVVYPEEPGPVARGLAAELGLEVFDRASVGAALGEILFGDTEPSRAAARSAIDDLPLETPTVVVPEGDRAVAARFGREDAERIVADSSLRPTLRWIPFYVAPYRVRVASPHGDPGRTDEHLVAVHALQRRAEAWERGGYELIVATDQSARLAPEIEPPSAREIALAWIRHHHTVRVEHTEQHGGTVVMETRRIPPGPDDVRIGPLTLVYVPYWYFEGNRGRVVLNAVTGRPYVPSEEPG